MARRSNVVSRRNHLHRRDVQERREDDLRQGSSAEGSFGPLFYDPGVVEEWKWRGVPTWYHDGIICTGETYKSVVKMTFAKGAALKDPSGLFNSSLDGNTRRAIDFHEGEKINAKALKALVRDAVALNESKAKR